MPNPKTGESRLVPDTREESIETITETYTPEGGAEQTATYKIFPVDTIIGGILDKAAFFWTHAAAVWYNKGAGRTVEDEIEDMKVKLQIVSLKDRDLNDIKESGIYTMPINNGATLGKHYPVAFAGFLEVFTYSQTWIMQRYTAYNTGKAYVRIFTSSWSNWMES